MKTAAHTTTKRTTEHIAAGLTKAEQEVIIGLQIAGPMPVDSPVFRGDHELRVRLDELGLLSTGVHVETGEPLYILSGRGEAVVDALENF
jgi:hypothetical protein